VKPRGWGVVVFAGLAVTAGMFSASGAPATALPAFQYYSYQEAVEAGMAPSVSQLQATSGLPECPLQPIDSGPTVAPSDRIGDPPACFADPDLATYLVSPNGPAASYASPYGLANEKSANTNSGGYYYMGSFIPTNGQPRQGVASSCAVTTPSGYFVWTRDHVGCFDAATYPVTSPNNPNYVQVGWTIGFPSPDDFQEIVTESLQNGVCNNCVIYWGQTYPIHAGTYYMYRSRGFWNGSRFGIIADIWWNNQWQEMTNSVIYSGYCQDGTGNSYCGAVGDIEVYAPKCNDGTGQCLNLSNTNPDNLGVESVSLRVAPQTWQAWTPSLETTTAYAGFTPYGTCWIGRYYEYIGGRNYSC
jgi:hypothetical protein